MLPEAKEGRSGCVQPRGLGPRLSSGGGRLQGRLARAPAERTLKIAGGLVAWCAGVVWCAAKEEFSGVRSSCYW